jgi:hypothetical protein
MSADQVNLQLFLLERHGVFVETWKEFWLCSTSIIRSPRFSCLVPWPRAIRL